MNSSRWVTNRRWNSTAQLVAMSAFVLTGCAEQADPAPSVIRADSAGVEIVRSSGAMWSEAEQLHLSSEPVLHIGVVDGPRAEQFTRIISAFWLSDDRIVAANFSNPPEIRVFSPDGRHEFSLGGSGEGPGEFAAISMAVPLPGDTLLVHDFWNGRLTYFGPEGELLQTRALLEIAGRPASAWVIRDTFQDGSFLAFDNRIFSSETSGSGRARRALVRVAPTGEFIDTVLVIPDVEYFTDPMGIGGVLFGLRSGWQVHDDRLHVATGEEFRVDVYDVAGSHLRSLRREYTRVPVRPEHVEAERQRRLMGAGSPDAAQRVDEALRRPPMANHFPATGQRILVGSDGSLWVKNHELPGAATRHWSVFGQDGVYLGDVQVPLDFQVMEVRGPRVLGVWTDELDVPAVRIYALETRGR